MRKAAIWFHRSFPLPAYELPWKYFAVLFNCATVGLLSIHPSGKTHRQCVMAVGVSNIAFWNSRNAFLECTGYKKHGNNVLGWQFQAPSHGNLRMRLFCSPWSWSSWNLCRAWGMVNHILEGIAGRKERPRVGKAVSIFLELDENIINEWFPKIWEQFIVKRASIRRPACSLPPATILNICLIPKGWLLRQAMLPVVSFSFFTSQFTRALQVELLPTSHLKFRYFPDFYYLPCMCG